MLLSNEQLELLRGDLDYILARTTCNTLQLTRGQVQNALERDPDVFLDLVDGLRPEDARWLSVPPDVLRPMISRRARGVSSGSIHSQPTLLEV
ncbi:MAG: hypothetical protein ACOYNN_12600 [Terrimicrobiaceae bacterium]|jgi:hypothetical protein